MRWVARIWLVWVCVVLGLTAYHAATSPEKWPFFLALFWSLPISAWIVWVAERE